MGWHDRLPMFKKAVKEEGLKRAARKVRSVCIHGETDCVRCAAEDFEAEQTKTTSWQTLDSEDLKRVVLALPKLTREILRRNPNKAVIAGGFIRAIIGNEAIHDVDLFVPSEAEAIAFTDNVGLKYASKEKRLDLNDEGRDVQIVWRYPFKEAYEVLEQFDYTVTKAAVWFDEGDKKHDPGYRSICHERFYRDIARKLLVYDCDRDVERLESIPRLMKYANYGYTIEPKSLAEVVIKTCLSLDLEQGFDGMRKQLETYYKPTGDDGTWAELTTKYEKPQPKPKPPPRSHDYSYGS